MDKQKEKKNYTLVEFSKYKKDCTIIEIDVTPERAKELLSQIRQYNMYHEDSYRTLI